MTSKTESRKRVPDFFGRLYPDDLQRGSLLGTWVRRAEVDELLDEIERLRWQGVEKLAEQRNAAYRALESIKRHAAPPHADSRAVCEAIVRLVNGALESSPEEPPDAEPDQPMLKGPGGKLIGQLPDQLLDVHAICDERDRLRLQLQRTRILLEEAPLHQYGKEYLQWCEKRRLQQAGLDAATCEHPQEWRTHEKCGICLQDITPEEPTPPHPGPSIAKAFAKSPRRVEPFSRGGCDPSRKPTAFQDYVASLPENGSEKQT